MKRKTIRQFLFYFVATILIGVATLWAVSHFLAPRLALRVAVGGDQGESAKFMTALAPLVGHDRWRMRFRQVNFASPEEAAAAMDAGKIDLMIARGDLAPRSKGQTLVIMRRDAIALILPPDSSIEKFADIAKKTVAIADGPLKQQDQALLKQLLAYYSIPDESVSRIIMPSADIGQAIRLKRVSAAFAIGPVGFGVIPDTVASIRKVMKKPPSILDLGEASAIVKKMPQLEALEISRGAVNGNPAIPDDTANTIAVSVRLLASTSMHDSLAGDIARIVTTRKSTLAEAAPGATQIEAPDTEDKNAVLPVHPGASTYFSGEQATFFDRFENFIYYGGLFASLIGSLIAWAIGSSRSARVEREEVSTLVGKMLESVRQIPAADTTRRKELMIELDTHADWALGELAEGRIDREKYGIVEAILNRGRQLSERAMND